jgi:hypothetical protein
MIPEYIKDLVFSQEKNSTAKNKHRICLPDRADIFYYGKV